MPKLSSQTAIPQPTSTSCNEMLFFFTCLFLFLVFLLEVAELHHGVILPALHLVAFCASRMWSQDGRRWSCHWLPWRGLSPLGSLSIASVSFVPCLEMMNRLPPTQLISVLDVRVSRIVSNILGEKRLCSLLVEGQDQVRMYRDLVHRDLRDRLPRGSIVATLSVGDLNLDLFRHSQGPHHRLLFDHLPSGPRGSPLYRPSGDRVRSRSRGASASSTSRPPRLGSGESFPEALAEHGASFLVNNIVYADTLSEEQKSTVAAVGNRHFLSLLSSPLVVTARICAGGCMELEGHSSL